MNQKPDEIHAGLVVLGQQDLFQLLHPPEGTHITSISADPLSRTIYVILEGPTLPVCPYGSVPERINSITQPKFNGNFDFIGLAISFQYPTKQEKQDHE